MYLKREKLRIIREQMEAGQQEYMACKVAGVTPKQLWVWAKKNPRIALWRKAVRERCDKKRVDLVTDALFKLAINGNMGAIAFFLKNKAGWKDVVEQVGDKTKIIVIRPGAPEENKNTRLPLTNQNNGD